MYTMQHIFKAAVEETVSTLTMSKCVMNQLLNCFGHRLLLDPITRAVSECERCVHIYRNGTEGMANQCA